jgi:DNA recombination protein RmuC
MRSLGERLNQAQGSYTGAMSKLSSGRGSLVKQIEDLKTMGAKTGKAVPADLLDVEETRALVISLAN